MTALSKKIVPMKKYFEPLKEALDTDFYFY